MAAVLYFDFEDHEVQVNRYSVKRFAYDILYLTLSKCGFPRILLIAEVGGENPYSTHDVNTVFAGVIHLAFNSRNHWKRLFERRLNLFGAGNMQNMREGEGYLWYIEKELQFQPHHSAGDKIRTSLAFYSEIILFLHAHGSDVDFDSFLDMWCHYFNERIAVNNDSNTLLRNLFFKDLNIDLYLEMVDDFIEHHAIPYLLAINVTGKYRRYSALLKKFRNKEISENVYLRLLAEEKVKPEFYETRQNPISENVEEAIVFFAQLGQQNRV